MTPFKTLVTSFQIFSMTTAMSASMSASRAGAAESRGGSGSGSSGGSSESTFANGKIEKELECVLNRVDAKNSAIKAKEFGAAFEKAWNELAQKGVKLPSVKDRTHFWAQILHESGKLEAMSEKGNGSSMVEGGAKFKGRGPIQLTHCYNYANFARFVKAKESGTSGAELFSNGAANRGQCPPSDLADSEIMKDPEAAMGDGAKKHDLQALSAIWWWEDNKKRQSKFREAVEGDDVAAVSKTVNGATNGLKERQNLFGLINSSGCVK